MGKLLTCAAIGFLLFVVSAGVAQEKKAKVEKVTGDIGLLDLEKNYMIVVTKEGKLVTIDFDKKTKVTKFVPETAKMSDIGLGESAAINYQKNKDKNILASIEIKVKAKKGE